MALTSCSSIFKTSLWKKMNRYQLKQKHQVNKCPNQIPKQLLMIWNILRLCRTQCQVSRKSFNGHFNKIRYQNIMFIQRIDLWLPVHLLSFCCIWSIKRKFYIIYSSRTIVLIFLVIHATFLFGFPQVVFIELENFHVQLGSFSVGFRYPHRISNRTFYLIPAFLVIFCLYSG